LEQVKTFIATIQTDLFDWTHNPTVEAKHKNRLTRRAVKANASVIIPFSKDEIIARDGLSCSICGKLLSEQEATIDHIIPLARGGHHRAENAQIACVKCNREKGEKLINLSEANNEEMEEIN
jgi:5-methylcytosine-specific restriction endonuclease McrA